MKPPKSNASATLGKSLIRDRFKGRGQRRDFKEDEIAFPLSSAAQSGKPTDWTGLGSVTEQGDLEEFLMSAELADKEFLSEKVNAQVVVSSAPLHQADPNRHIDVQLRESYSDMLRIPRRPVWNEETSTKELHRQERVAFLDWRRKLALFQESSNILLTPYEKNIEMWRQLWRVLEKSHVIVQIVDARNPLLFHCRDLIQYAAELDPRKKNILLVNKADFLTREQRSIWADYFRSVGLDHVFYSAELQMKDVLEYQARLRKSAVEASKSQVDSDVEMNADDDEDDSDNSNDNSNDDEDETVEKDNEQKSQIMDKNMDATSHASQEEKMLVETLDDESDESADTKIVSRDDLLDIFESYHDNYFQEKEQLMIGLVGYPNVGKSSTINSIMASKKVAVGPTPGKTKHFQTLILSESLCLVDCPGLVFPNFSSTKAELIVNGILPIDQMREYVSPVTLVAQRIPRAVLERLYGICLPSPSEGEDEARAPTAHELLSTYAALRGYRTTNQGNPDESRASRYILKDYVQGKLLFIHPPPACSFSERDFNLKNEYKASRLLHVDLTLTQAPKARGMSELDMAFFDERASHIEAVTTGKASVKGFQRSSLGIGLGMPTMAAAKSKKHYKKNKRNSRK